MRRPMDLPVAAGLEPRVSGGTASTAMQCLRPLCHPGGTQLCTLLAFSQQTSPGMLFQQVFPSLLAAFPSLCGPTHRKPSQLCRPGHLMQHSITVLLGQIVLTQPGGVLCHCPVGKQKTVPLSANQMGWHIAAECCGSHAGSVCLEF